MFVYGIPYERLLYNFALVAREDPLFMHLCTRCRGLPVHFMHTYRSDLIMNLLSHEATSATSASIADLELNYCRVI